MYCTSNRLEVEDFNCVSKSQTGFINFLDF